MVWCGDGSARKLRLSMPKNKRISRGAASLCRMMSSMSGAADGIVDINRVECGLWLSRGYQFFSYVVQNPIQCSAL